MHVASAQGDDKPGHGIGVPGGQQKVNVVGHEGVGVKGAPFFLERLAQPVEIGLVVFFAEEAGLANFGVSELHLIRRVTPVPEHSERAPRAIAACPANNRQVDWSPGGSTGRAVPVQSGRIHR